MTEGGISPVPREARPYQGRRAGLVTRIVAAAIDGILVGFALLGGYLALAGFLFLVDPRGFTFPEVGLIFSMASAFVVLVVYLTVSWWISGRSYGCLVMGLRVVGRGGHPIRLTGALLRALFCATVPHRPALGGGEQREPVAPGCAAPHLGDLRLAAAG